MVVILLGPPGVGKGTQGVLLTDALGWSHVATGDLLRAAVREGTELGKEAQKFMEAGELVPDDVIVGMVKDHLGGIGGDQGVVLDGFPRTLPQAEALSGVLPEVGRVVDRVVVLEASDDVLVKRLSGRRSCPGCGAVFNVHFNQSAEEGRCDRCGEELVHRSDDNPETVQNRLDVYRAQTEPLIRFYEGTDSLVVSVEAEGDVDGIQSEVRAAVR